MNPYVLSNLGRYFNVFVDRRLGEYFHRSIPGYQTFFASQRCFWDNWKQQLRFAKINTHNIDFYFEALTNYIFNKYHYHISFHVCNYNGTNNITALDFREWELSVNFPRIIDNSPDYIYEYLANSTMTQDLEDILSTWYQFNFQNIFENIIIMDRWYLPGLSVCHLNGDQYEAIIQPWKLPPEKEED